MPMQHTRRPNRGLFPRAETGAIHEVPGQCGEPGAGASRVSPAVQRRRRVAVSEQYQGVLWGDGVTRSKKSTGVDVIYSPVFVSPPSKT
jgi:hypothetical protein